MQLPRFFQQKVSSWLLVLPGFLLIGLFAVPLRALTVRAINANFFEYALSAQALAALRLSLVTSRPFTASAVVIAQIFVAAPLYVRAARIGFAEIDIQIE